MEKSFSSLAELQAEIQFLKVQQFKQEEVLKEQLSSPKAIFTTLGHLFKTDSGRQSLVKDFVNQDMITNISRVILPIFLNGVVFKKAGFITKAIITFLSQKAAKQVNSHAVSGIVDKITSFFKKKESKHTEAPKAGDYGIPPDSETY